MNILLVDDDAELRQSLADVLKDAGHSVTEAGDGRAATALLAAQTFDVVLSDVQLPGVDGLTLAAERFARMRRSPTSSS